MYEKICNFSSSIIGNFQAWDLFCINNVEMNMLNHFSNREKFLEMLKTGEIGAHFKFFIHSNQGG